MTGFREQFYRFIAQEIAQSSYDWDLEKQQPFLLRFLREQAERQAEKEFRIQYLAGVLSSGRRVSKQAMLKELNRSNHRATNANQRRRTDLYTDVLEADLKRQLRIIDVREYLCYVFELILNKKKIGIPDRLLEKICDLLDACELPKNGRLNKLNVKISGMSFHHKRTNRIPLEEILDELHGISRLPVPSDKEKRVTFEEKLNIVTEEIYHEILMMKAKTWLGDNNPEKKRKEDHSMLLLDAFFQQKGTYFDLTGHQEDSAELTAERKEQTQALFELLDHDPERRSVVIPVIIDPFTGLGLYIIGAGEVANDNIMIDYDDGRNAFLQKGHNCAYAVFCYAESVYTKDLYKDVSGGFLKFDIMRDDIPASAGGGIVFPGTRFVDAISYYQNKLNCFDEDDRTLNNYLIDNGFAPKGCPEAFLRYFEWEEEEALESMREKKEAYMEEEKRQLAAKR